MNNKSASEVVAFIEMLNSDGLNFDVIIISPSSGDEIYVLTGGQFEPIGPGINEIKISGINITKFVHAEVLDYSIMSEPQKKTLTNRIMSEPQRTRYYHPNTPYVRYNTQYHN